MKQYLKKIIFNIFIICIFLVSTSCEYIIQLPNIEGNQGVQEKVNEKSTDINSIMKQLEETYSDDKKINILVIKGGESLAAKELSSEFEKKFGKECAIFEADWEIARQLLVAVLSTITFGTSSSKYKKIPIDIVFFPDYALGSIRNYLEDLNYYISPDNFNTKDYIPNIFTLTSYWQDSIKGLPINTSICSVMYKANFSPNTNNWSYEYYNKFLKTLDSNKLLLNTKILNIYWSNRFWALGGDTTLKDSNITLDHDLGVKSLEMLKIAYDHFDKKNFNKSYEDIVSSFVNEDYIIFEGDPIFLITDYYGNNNFDAINIKSLPEGPAGSFLQLRSTLISITKTSKYKKEAWEWLKLFSDNYHSKLFLEKYGLLAPKVSLFEDSSLNKKYKFLNDIYDIYKSTNIKSIGNITATHDVWEVMINNKLSDYLVNNKDPNIVIKEIEKEWNEILIGKPPDIGYKK